MALRPCPDCGHDVSERAPICPQCGAPIAETPGPHLATAHDPAMPTRVEVVGQGSGGNVLAALCSLIIPGLGQLVQGRLGAAFLWFFAVPIAGFLTLLSGATKEPTVMFLALLGALALYFWNVYDAATFRRTPDGDW
jgi:hypothetical protein